MKPFIRISCALGMVGCGLVSAQDVPWTHYGADSGGTKYSGQTQIDAQNFSQLELAWRWQSSDQQIVQSRPSARPHHFEATPLMVDGVLYTSTSLSQVAAIDPATGNTLWNFDPQSYMSGSPPNLGYAHRGVAHWKDDTQARVFIATGDARLWALDAVSGEAISTFGNAGQVDLTQGLRRSVARVHYGVSSPPAVCGNVVVVGASILDYPSLPAMPPGDIRGFDPVTGQQLWTFHTVPQSGEPGNETWGDGSADRYGGVNAWSIMTCDEQTGMIYVPLGTATNDYYGAERPGDNLYSESLVALDAATGKRQWHYQFVRHGIWDYDLPAAPNLVDLTIDNKRVPAVAQVTKQGYVFVFDRRTGEPIWPIEEQAVPGSTVSDEQPSPTQPRPSKPAPFALQGIALSDATTLSSSLRSEAESILGRYDLGPIYSPPSVRGRAVSPGIAGGASWAGAAFDPHMGTLYVPSITLPFVLPLNSRNASTDRMVGAPQVLPFLSIGVPPVDPPYGRVTAIDLNTGEHRWTEAVGEGPRNHPSLSGLGLARLGWARRSFALVTDSLLLVAQEGATRYLGSSPQNNADQYTLTNADPALLAYDPQTGSLIGKVPLPGNATGSPMSYRHQGVQYVVVPTGGSGIPAELVALRLPAAEIKTTIDISPKLNGFWFDPTTSGQGLAIEVLAEREQMVVAWYTYAYDNDDLAAEERSNLRWFTALGPYTGGRSELDVTQTTGGRFADPKPVTNSPPQTFGTIVLEFSDCNHGSLHYFFSKDDKRGDIPIQRLASSPECPGDLRQ